MTFFKIQDPNKRDEIVREMNEKEKEYIRIVYYPLLSFQMSGVSPQDSRNPASLTGNNMTSCARLREDGSSYQSDSARDAKESEGGSIKNSSNQEVPSTIPEMQKLMNAGEFASHYLKMYTSNNISNKNRMDKTFGVQLKEGEFFIGKDQIMINNDDIIIGDKLYRGTTGLWELITKNEPDATIYNDEDYKNYREILIDTKAIRSDSNPNKPKASRSEKYRKIIKPLWNEVAFKRKGKKGNGVIILPSDPNALKERFALSVAAWHAGNKGSRNEAVSICDELLRQHVIDKNEYKSMIGYIDAK